MENRLIPRTPEAEVAHQAFLKRCQDDLFLLPALKGLIDAWLVSDGENTEILSIGLANVARPIIRKQVIDEIVAMPHGTTHCDIIKALKGEKG